MFRFPFLLKVVSHFGPLLNRVRPQIFWHHHYQPCDLHPTYHGPTTCLPCDAFPVWSRPVLLLHMIKRDASSKSRSSETKKMTYNMLHFTMVKLQQGLCCWCSVLQHWPTAIVGVSFKQPREHEFGQPMGTSVCWTQARIKAHWFCYKLVFWCLWLSEFQWHGDHHWWWVTSNMKRVASIHSWTSVTTRLNWDNTIEDLISYNHVVTVQNLNDLLTSWWNWRPKQIPSKPQILLSLLCLKELATSSLYPCMDVIVLVLLLSRCLCKTEELSRILATYPCVSLISLGVGQQQCW